MLDLVPQFALAESEEMVEFGLFKDEVRYH